MTPDGPDDTARERQREQADAAEHILETVREDLGEREYPTTSEELAAHYGEDPIDLPNETESVGSAFRRLESDYDDAEEAFTAYRAAAERDADAPLADAEGESTATWDEARGDDAPPADERGSIQQDRAGGDVAGDDTDD